ncbi:MAG: thioredoxin family protein [Bacteroidetes bacterium]|nr:thioredoxin family protein [Bacteroidota bacterium]
MKNIIFTGIAIILFVVGYAYNNPNVDFKSDKTEGILFYRGNWNEALQLAKKENKLIFLDIYATWCGPCKKLKKNSFSNIEVGKFYNSNFINVSLDGEQGEGAMLASQYRIPGYPSLLFIDATGKIVESTGGYLNPKELLKLGKSITK